MTDIRFTKEHEWIRREGGTATVGITVHAQTALGDIVFVDLPKVGAPLKANTPCAVVESVKAASDVFAPLSGQVTEINVALAGDPALVNREPLSGGWFFRMAMSEPGEFDTLMDEAAYALYTGAQA